MTSWRKSMQVAMKDLVAGIGIFREGRLGHSVPPQTTILKHKNKKNTERNAL